jgi:short subunit dehydrogenase-like uncharacterized protein
MSASATASAAPRAYDLLVYGATGFTGRLVARYLVAKAPPTLRWGIAGRDEAKLRAIAAELADLRRATGSSSASSSSAQEIGIVVGGGETASNVARSARVVVSTAGPFALFGEPLLAACVREGTDYVDITGETLWVSQMLDKYGAEAAAKGVCIVPMSGFDSVPADLGTFFVVDHVRRTLNVPVAEVCGYMAGKGNVSGGTIASALNLATHPERRKAASRTLLVPSTPGGPAPSTLVAPLSDFRSPFFVNLFRQFAAFFVMAPVNTRVVRRSAALFALQGHKLGPAPSNSLAALPSASTPATASSSHAYSTAPFRYTEYMLVRSRFQAWTMTLGIGLFGLLSSVPGFIPLIRRFLPKPGQGPSEKTMASSWFHYYLVARTEEANPRTVIGRVRGGDGGYEETSKMIGEAGMALALQRASLPGTALGGGFLTPATCFGRVLVDRLTAANMLFEIVPENALPGALKDRRPPPPTSSSAPGQGAGEDSSLLKQQGSVARARL